MMPFIHLNLSFTFFIILVELAALQLNFTFGSWHDFQQIFFGRFPRNIRDMEGIGVKKHMKYGWVNYAQPASMECATKPWSDVFLQQGHSEFYSVIITSGRGTSKYRS